MNPAATQRADGEAAVPDVGGVPSRRDRSAAEIPRGGVAPPTTKLSEADPAAVEARVPDVGGVPSPRDGKAAEIPRGGGTPPTADARETQARAVDEAGSDQWIAAMRRGDFAGAWNISDAILRERRGIPCWHLPRHEQYLWDGQPLAGKRVLVRCYHGLGDTVQFIRYIPLLHAIAREVIVWAQPALLPLLATVEGIDQLLPLHDGVPEAEYDADVELMELPHCFRTTLETLPATVPYLHAPTALATDGIDVGRGRVREVGIIWQSGDWDERRSIPTHLLEPLARLPGIHLHALQQGAALKEWPSSWGPIGATPDPTELARRMGALDLVISVDSFPAHLAGALGVRTWTLLHADPDWRWMLGRGDSPWYPTMRLWRQEKPGNWPAVIQRVAEALRERA